MILVTSERGALLLSQKNYDSDCVPDAMIRNNQTQRDSHARRDSGRRFASILEQALARGIDAVALCDWDCELTAIDDDARTLLQQRAKGTNWDDQMTNLLHCIACTDEIIHTLVELDAATELAMRNVYRLGVMREDAGLLVWQCSKEKCVALAQKCWRLLSATEDFQHLLRCVGSTQ